MYISFEGIDGAGKSTIMERVAEALKKDETLKEYGYDKIVTSGEPKGIFRSIILDADNKYDVNELGRFFLYQADRAIHTEKVVIPNKDSVLLIDRGPVSTLAYQNITTGMTFSDMANIIKKANHNIWPDLYVYFKIDYETSAKRLTGEKDYFDKMGKEFFEKLIRNYDLLLDKYTITDRGYNSRVIEIDATQDVETVYKKVYEEVYRYILAHDIIHERGREF